MSRECCDPMHMLLQPCDCLCHKVAELEQQLKELDGRRQAAVTMHDRVAGELLASKTKVLNALNDLTTARPAIQWVLNHWDRCDDHDKKHAELAHDEVSHAIETLRRITQ